MSSKYTVTPPLRRFYIISYVSLQAGEEYRVLISNGKYILQVKNVNKLQQIV